MLGKITWNYHAQLQVLIAEDDEANQFYLQTLLKRADMTVHLASNGKEAVDIIRNLPDIHLVLMDIRMPVMDGIEATRQIKSFRKELPVIAVTAYAMTGDERKAREAGCDEYLTKPLSKNLLFEKILKYLTKNSIPSN
mgnify:CR=1 FL=1